jgi:tetratricopeptide (TPR) repeat protein
MNRFSRAFTVTARLLGGWLCLAALTGCGTEDIKQQKIQSNLAEAQRQAILGHTQEARQWVDRAITIAPKTAATYVATTNDSLGIADLGDGEAGVFTSVGDNASVVHYLTKAVQQFPDDANALQALADAQGRLGDIAGQRTTAAKLAVLIESQLGKPGHTISAGLINQLAQAYWDAGDPVKGAANFRRVITTYPLDDSLPYAENGLAYDYADSNDKAHLAEALSLAQTALHLAQKSTTEDRESLTGDIQDTIGWIQYRQADFKNALINLQKGLNANPRTPEGRYHLALTYKALGDTDSARTELSYALKLSPDYADAKRELAVLPSAH